MSSTSTRRGSQSSKDPCPCGKCGKNVSDNVNALTCDMCGWWHHARCEGVSDHTYQTVQGGAQGLRWFCRKCDKFVVNLVSGIQQIGVRQDELEIKFLKMEKMIEDLKENNKTTLQELSNGAKKTYASVISDNHSNKIPVGENKEEHESTIKNSIKEINDRLTRKKNIVLHNVTESQSTESETRKIEDGEIAIEIIEQGMGCSVIIESSRRLGAKKQDNPSPRPLLVKLQTQEQAEQCLKSWRILKENPGYEHYGIQRDMTFLERADMKKLVMERNRRRDQTREEGGSEVWAIRGGKVINTARKEKQTTQEKEEPLRKKE